MRKYLFISILGLIACQTEVKEFKELNSKVGMKYHQLGEGKKPRFGETVEVNMLLSSVDGDTLHFVPNYPYFIELQGTAIDSALITLTEGDSVTFRLPRKVVNQQFRFYKLLQLDTGLVDMHIRLKRSYEKEEAEKRRIKAISIREVNEMAAFKAYIGKNGNDLEEFNGIYRKVSGDITGDSIRFGSEVSIHYKGSFLEGYVFDDTYQKGITPTFTFGKEYQMIEGMQIGLSGLHEGESVKIILPSRRAFGEEGSLAGIVPPYTAVIFEVNIIKVKN